jgi:hypothetical protein
MHNIEQSKLAQRIVNYGADAIVGSHPHVIQPFDYITRDYDNVKVPVIYSVGNFVSNQRNRYRNGGIIFELYISKIKNIILVIKKIPVFINEIINFFNTPIAHKFLNPIDGKNIEENENNYTQLKFLYFLFIENKNFSKNKTPQKGRIKRKILRKVTFENKIVD